MRFVGCIVAHHVNVSNNVQLRMDCVLACCMALETHVLIALSSFREFSVHEHITLSPFRPTCRTNMRSDRAQLYLLQRLTYNQHTVYESPGIDLLSTRC